uniref:Uncharacterized protein n=1 Tax=Kalanchoe fedtschenkoi TaxID=63787 RepID=A0A7N0T992_KALFE
MEKTQSSSKPQYGVYGRIKKAITFSNPLQQSPPVNYPEHPHVSKPVPIEFDHSVFSKTTKKHPVFASSKEKVVRTGGVELPEKSEAGNNDRFSDYIKRAKMKMRRSMTEVSSGGVGGRVKGGLRLESINEKTSAFIDRAKVKMRRTASIAGFGRKSD